MEIRTLYNTNNTLINHTIPHDIVGEREEGDSTTAQYHINEKIILLIIGIGDHRYPPDL